MATDNTRYLRIKARHEERELKAGRLLDPGRPKAAHELALERFEERQRERAKVVNLGAKREELEEQKHRIARLMMLMHSFLDAEAAGDHEQMKMYGRGISGYSREERQDAYECALNARREAGQVNTDGAPTPGPDEPTAA